MYRSSQLSRFLIVTLAITMAIAAALPFRVRTALASTVGQPIVVGNDSVTFQGVLYDYSTPGRSTWYYTVVSGSKPAISHVTFDIWLDACLAGDLVSAGTWDGADKTSLKPNDGTVVVGQDPTTGQSYVLKFDQGFSEGETRHYYFTIDGNLAEGLIKFVSKAATSYDTAWIPGPNGDCSVVTPTPTPTATATNTPTATPTNTPLPTNTPTATPTNTPLPTNTPTATPTNTPEPTNTPLPTATPTNTPEPTSTPLPTATPTNTPEPTSTPLPTATPTNTPLPTSTPLPTATPTNTPEPTSTPLPTATPTNTPLPTSTPLPTATPTNTPLPTSTPLPTATPTNTPEPTSTPLPTATPTNTPEPTSTPLPTATPTPALAAIGDYVWADDNADGIQDSSESGIPGITVTLYSAAGTPILLTTTNANGYYLFPNLTPGDYYLVFTVPADAQVSPLNAGPDRGLDSDAGPDGRTAVTTLEAGEQDLTWDLGLIINVLPTGEDVGPEPELLQRLYLPSVSR